MICSVCKKSELKESFTTYYKKVNDIYFIIENVPCFKCELCGEVSFGLKILEKIEKLINNAKDCKKANIMQYDVAA